LYCLFVWYGTDYIRRPIPFNHKAVTMKIRRIFQLILAVDNDFMHFISPKRIFCCNADKEACFWGTPPDTLPGLCLWTAPSPTLPTKSFQRWTQIDAYSRDVRLRIKVLYVFRVMIKDFFPKPRQRQGQKQERDHTIHNTKTRQSQTPNFAPGASFAAIVYDDSVKHRGAPGEYVIN